MEVAGEVGGVMTIISVVFGFLLTPFYYYKNEIEVMLELEKN